MNRQILSLLVRTFENYLGQEAFEEHLAYYNFRNDPSTVLHCETNSYFRATLMFHPCAEPTIYFQSISPLFCIRVGVTNTWHGNQRTTGTWRLSNYRRIKYGPLTLCCTTRKYFSLSYFEKNSFFSLSFLLNLHFWVCDRSRGYSRRPSKLPMMHWIPIYRAPYPPTPSTPTPLSLTLAQLQTWDIWPPALPPCLWHLVAIIGDLFQFVHWTSLYRPPGTNIWWLQKYVQLASGRYASYWNAFFY